MNEAYYPDVNAGALLPIQVVKEQLIEHDNYLSDPECPYDTETKALIANLLSSADGEEPIGEDDLKDGQEKFELMEKECLRLFNTLKRFGSTLSVEDTSEKMAYFRTSTQLLEKIINLSERASGLNQYHKAFEAILNIIDEELDPDQKTRVMERLGEVT